MNHAATTTSGDSDATAAAAAATAAVREHITTCTAVVKFQTLAFCLLLRAD
jgi:hypothetical protein